MDVMPAAGLLNGARQDRQTMTFDWRPVAHDCLIEGVCFKPVRHVLKDNGHLTEVFRADWALDAGKVDQIFSVLLEPRGLSAWHAHTETTDRLFCLVGNVKIVLYDAREGSPTHGKLDEFRLGVANPMLLVVPPGVWHGVQNTHAESAVLLNAVDQAYRYESPDHWRLPSDTPEIPYRFS